MPERLTIRFARGLTAAALLAGAGAVAGAQAPAAGAPAGGAPAACTYDACALRRERVFFSERLLAGTRGTVVARPRFAGAFAVDSIVRPVPEAVPHAERYRREQVRGQVLTLVGTLLSAAALVDAVRNADGGTCAVVGGVVGACSNDGWRGRDTALLLGGLAFSVAGGWRLQIADRSLNRAIWYYNRALPR